MEFKKWLENYGTASLVSGEGGGPVAFDNLGNQLALPKKKKKTPPLGEIDIKLMPSPISTKDKIIKI